MKEIKDFQERYNRWKNGERYWDIRGIDLPKYDIGKKNTNNQAYIFQRPDGTYYSSPTNDGAFIEDVTPVLKRDLSNEDTWDFVGSNTNKRYITQYTDDQLRQMAQDSMPNAEMIPWIDRAGNKQRSARIIGLSPADPVASTAVEIAAGLPEWKALDYATNKLAIDFARDFAFTKLGNWTRNKILSNQLNKNIENAALSASYPYSSKVLNIMPKRSNGRYQFDKPTYQIYTGPKHDISEVINGRAVNLPKLIKIQNEALKNIPNGTIARHRLENAKWHPTDWNTFLHTRDVYKRALDNNYPQEALFPALMHDFGKMWSGDGHGPYGASIVRQIFPKASNEQIQAIYEHMDSNPLNRLSRLVKGVDIKEPNVFRNEYRFVRPVSNKVTKNEGVNKSFTDINDGLPWAYNNGQWDMPEIQKQAQKGVDDLRAWVTNPEFKRNQALNKIEAENMGLEYVPFWERPEAVEQFNRYGTNGTIILKVEPGGDLGWVENTVRGGHIPEYSHIANVNLAGPFPYAETVTHEGGHTFGMGGPYYNKKLSIKEQIKSAELQQQYLEYKSGQILNPGYDYQGFDLSEHPYEAVQNIRDIGRELGLSVGQQYPGYDEALKILQNTSLLKNPVKQDIAKFLKTDKTSMPNVWKALTGTFFSVPVLTNSTIHKNEKEK